MALQNEQKVFTEQSGSSPIMAFYYSKRFPGVRMSSSFFDNIMNITEMYVNHYQSCWIDFSQQYSEPSFNEPTVPWTIPVLPPPIHKENTSVHNVNYNNNQRDLSNSQLSNKPVKVLVSTSSCVDSFTASSSTLDFEEPITPIKVMSKNNNCNNNCKKAPKKKYNKIHIEDDDSKNGRITSDSSRSDITIGENTLSYAGIIKCSKPKTPKIIEKLDYNTIVEEPKRESIISNRVPPSKKIPTKLREAPFLSNRRYCSFCKNNGEDESIYRTHTVKDKVGNVTCPFLFVYTCPHCKATGAKAHTISRCPINYQNTVDKYNK